MKTVTLEFVKSTKNYHVFEDPTKKIANLVYLSKDLFMDPENPGQTVDINLSETPEG